MEQLCKICCSQTSLFDKSRILGKYDISYYSCPCCGFVQTEEPFWLEEAYSDAITSSDIGLCGRNIEMSRVCDTVFRVLFSDKKKFIDYGGGYGMFVRLMRDRGYDFEWYDEYCSNLFAKGHEMKTNHYDVLTSFEMLEHLVNPLETLNRMFSLADTVVFSTELIPEYCPKVTDWWYYGTDHGQHVAFYTKKSLEFVARKFNRNYYCLGNLHIITPISISRSCMLLLSHNKFRSLISLLLPRRKSLLNDDYFALTGKRI